MISKTSKVNNSILSEMVSIMESKEHKQMFEPVVKTAQVVYPKENVPASTPDTTVFSSPFEDVAKEDLAKTQTLPFESATGPDNLSMSNSQTKSVNAPGVVQDKTQSLTPEIAPSQLGESVYDPNNPPGVVPSTAAVLEVLVKIANYLGESNLLQSEAVADMLIETVLSETK